MPGQPSPPEKMTLPSQTPGLSGVAAQFTGYDASDGLKLVPGGDQALFSTDLGRQPPRHPPIPLPPMIARGVSQMQGLAQEAGYWYNRHPLVYMCLFPHCGYTIHDLWDHDYIYRNDPKFVEQLLSFIVWGNANNAQQFLIQWSQQHRHRLEAISKDLGALNDHSDPLAIVDRTFVDGELNTFPRHFLWHCLNMMRIGMLKAVEICNHPFPAAKHASNITGGGRNESGDLSMPKSTNNINGLTSEMCDEPTVSCARQGSEHNSTGDLRSSPIPNQFLSPIMRDPASPFIPAVHNSPHPSMFSQDIHQLHNHNHFYSCLPGESVTYAPVGVPLPTPGDPFAPRTRPPRTYAHQAQQLALPENVSRQPPSSLLYSASTTVSLVGSPPFQARTPSAQAQMQAPRQRMHQSQSTELSSPMAAHSQLLRGNPARQASMSLDPSIRPMYHQAAQSSPHHGQIGDMTNHAQHGYSGIPQYMVPHDPSIRRVSLGEKSLYDPYGSGRPSFGTVPSQNMQRTRAASNFQARPRKSSSVSNARLELQQMQHRSAYNSPVQYIRHDRGSLTFPNSDRSVVLDMQMVNDKERGCDHDWIGPSNNTVRTLIVFGLSETTTVDEIAKLVEDRTDAKGAKLSFKADKFNKVYSTIEFERTEEAAKALKLNGQEVEGKEITVRVHKMHYTVRSATDPTTSPMHGSIVDVGPGHRRMSTLSQGLGHLASGDVQYSPQDARSDLRIKDARFITGSPEAQKSKSPRMPRRKKTTCDAASESIVQTSPSNSESRRVAEELLQESDTSALAKKDDHSEETEHTAHAGDYLAGIASSAIQGLQHPEQADTTSLDNHPETNPTIPESTIADISECVPSPSNINPRSSKPVKASSTPDWVQNAIDTKKIQECELPNTKEDLANTSSAKPPEEQVANTVPVMDEPSDDEQRHDASFHSAQEEPQEVSEVIALPTTRESQQASSHVLSIPIATLTTPDKRDVQMGNFVPKEEADCSVISSPSSKTAVASSVDEKEEALVDLRSESTDPNTFVDASSTVASTATENRPVNQAESLHPFARSKAQQKKEKEMRKKQKKKARAEKANSKTKGTTTLARSPREAGTKDCLDSSLGLTKGSDQETFPAKLDASKLGPSTAQIDIGSHASGDAKDESRIPILTKAMELDEVPGGCLRPLPRNSAAPVTSSAHTPCSPPQDSASYTAISDDTPQAQAPDSRNNIFSEGPSFYDHQTVAQSSTVQVSKKHSDHSNDRPKASCMDQIQAEDKKEDDHGNKNASATSTIHPGLEFINHDDSQGAVTELRDKAADGSGLNEHQGSTVPNPAAKPLGPLSGTSTATGISVSDHPNIKKKPKKKKKKVLNSADPETAVEDVAFTEQVKQIDDLKDDPETIFCSSPQNYFASRDAAMAQTASRSIRKSTVNAGPPDSQEPKEIVKKSFQVSLLQSIRDYTREKESTYALYTEESFRSNKDPLDESLTFEQIEKILETTSSSSHERIQAQFVPDATGDTRNYFVNTEKDVSAQAQDEASSIPLPFDGTDQSGI